tara:strand:+ start:4766 stop:5602 length:837 start_codon:yes stop_codon:yes gene_type:complete
MKQKILKYSLLTTILGVTIWSCKKEQTTTATQTIPTNQITVLNSNNRSNGMVLSFPDMNTFKETVEDLENQVEYLDNNFINTYSHLSEDEINVIEEEIGFNENQPLIDFENQHGFSSLRAKIDEESEIYNQIEYPSEDIIDPDDDVIFDDNIRTVLNIHHEVIINDTMYRINQDGSYLRIDTVDLELLSSTRGSGSNSSNFWSNFPKVSLHSRKDSTTSCGRNREAKKKESGNYRIKWMMKLYNLPWDGGLKLRVKGYKKKKKKMEEVQKLLRSCMER